MKKVCPNCGDSFDDESDKRRKFCSHSCSSAYNKNRKGTGRIKIECSFCGKAITRRSDRKYCNSECQANGQYAEFIKEWIAGKRDGGKNGRISQHVRKWLFYRAGNACEAILPNGNRCGWGRSHPITGLIPLTAHHKDGCSDNHRPENLELICPCCHSLTETYGKLNNGNGRKSRKSGR